MGPPSAGPAETRSELGSMVAEGPLDAANESLADALRSSFRMLKGIMLILLVLYLVSNVRTVDGSEQAVILRLGRLLPGVHESGLIWAFPYPVDEVIVLPTRKSNTIIIDRHTFHRSENELGKPLSFISRNESDGLHPVLDGALLTADAGLVHAQWKVTYKIDDVQRYISRFVGDRVDSAEQLIRLLIETTGVEVASELTAEEFVRTKVDVAQSAVRRRLNERLVAADVGITATLVEMFEPTPPLQIRDVFDGTQRAENARQSRIRDAEQTRARTLNECAGAVHAQLLRIVDDLEAVQRGSPAEAELRGRLDQILMTEVEGRAGQLIKDAGTYLSVTVGRMRGDVQVYRTLVPEYERNPAVLITRLWEQTRQEIFDAPGVLKLYRPADSPVRLHVGPDPEQSRIDEEKRLQEQKFDMTKLRPTKMIPLGPEAG